MVAKFKGFVNWLTNIRLKEKIWYTLNNISDKQDESVNFPLYVIGTEDPFGSLTSLFVV